MNPFRDVIPDGHGEELERLMLERDGADKEGRPKKRPRTETIATLPTEILDSADYLAPLKAEDDLTKYTPERLQQGLAPIKGAARREISPRTQEFLRIHEEAYKIAMTEKEPGKRALAVVKKMDEVYQSSAFYLEPYRDDRQERSILKLRKLEFLASYGGYLGQDFTKIRADLTEVPRNVSDEGSILAAKEPGGQYLWTDISENMGRVNGADLKRHAEVASHVVGIDAEHMVWVVDQYTNRSLEFHNAIHEVVRQCRWYDAAQLLCRDLKDLINVIEDPERVKYETVLLGIRDEFFDIEDPDDPQGWFSNDHARTLYRTKRARYRQKEGRDSNDS